MIEDILGWVVVLIGAVTMKFTNLPFIDPVMSIGVAIFIFTSALKNLKEAINILLEKTPQNVDTKDVKQHITTIDGIIDVHHLHIWTLDGQSNYATAHIVTNSDPCQIKKIIREKLRKYGIMHITLELEAEGEYCSEKHCCTEFKTLSKCHRHHHHH
jgi:cobalt-zinc-cadmium efflux system protein